MHPDGERASSQHAAPPEPARWRRRRAGGWFGSHLRRIPFTSARHRATSGRHRAQRRRGRCSSARLACAQRQQQGQGTAVDASVRRPRRVVLAAAAGCRAPLRCPYCPGHPRGGGRALGVLRRTNRPVSSLRRPHASLAAFKANGQRHGGALGAIDGRGAGARASAATHPAAVRGRLQRRRGAHARRLLLGSWWGGWPGS